MANILAVVRLTTEPLLKQSVSGKVYTSFGVVDTESPHNDPQFYNVIAWENNALAFFNGQEKPYVHTGSTIFVNGKLTKNVNKQSGQTVLNIVLVCRPQFLIKEPFKEEVPAYDGRQFSDEEIKAALGVQPKRQNGSDNNPF